MVGALTVSARLRGALALGLGFSLLACAVDSPLGDCPDCPVPTAPGLLVSEPIPAPFGAGAGQVAWVALEAGAVTSGFTAQVRMSSGGTVRRAVINGGFDPAPLAAVVGDTVTVTVSDPAGRVVGTWQAQVKEKKPLFIVRTEPPPRKRGVPLNAGLLVVFSEPVDPGTVTDQTLRLFNGGIPQRGQVHLSPDGISAVFQPVGFLHPNTDYLLDITAGVRGLDGEPLATPLQVAFTTGSQQSGFIRVITATTGLSLDPDGYRVVVDADTSGAPAIQAPDTLLFAVEEGAHTITFLGSAPICAVLNPRWTGVVQAAQTTTVRALVDCASSPRTGLFMEIVTAGSDLPDDYALTLCDESPCYDGWRWGGLVLANTVKPIEMPAGTYAYRLTRVPFNCSGQTAGSVAVVEGQMTRVRLDLVCSATAKLRVSTSTTGPDQPQGYPLRVDGPLSHGLLPPTGSLTLDLAPGRHTVSLDMPSNCTAAGSNQATVDLPVGTITDVTFLVTCQSLTP